ncbi:MAG: TadE family protein [Eubacteriales bacterium]
MKKFKWLFKKREKGQAMVETALVLPLFLLVVCGIIDFGWIYANQLMLNSSSRDGARYAVVRADNTDMVTEVTQHLKENITLIESNDLNVTVVVETDGDISVTCQSDVKVLTPLTGIFVSGQTISLTSTTVMSTD